MAAFHAYYGIGVWLLLDSNISNRAGETIASVPIQFF